jgi:hypothetical protein
MKRLISWLACGLAVGVVAVAAAACDDRSGDYPPGAYGGGGAYGCGQYSTCGSCTPVNGCGWCQTPTGEGLCTADPDNCANVPEFSWTWDPQGCHTFADASVGPELDAGVVVPADAALLADAIAPLDSAPPVDAALPLEDGGDAGTSH